MNAGERIFFIFIGGIFYKMIKVKFIFLFLCFLFTVWNKIASNSKFLFKLNSRSNSLRLKYQRCTSQGCKAKVFEANSQFFLFKEPYISHMVAFVLSETKKRIYHVLLSKEEYGSFGVMFRFLYCTTILQYRTTILQYCTTILQYRTTCPKPEI